MYIVVVIVALKNYHSDNIYYLHSHVVPVVDEE
jgi:hypothetical protein